MFTVFPLSSQCRFFQRIPNRRHVLAKLDWWMTGNEKKKWMMKMKMKDETLCRLSITECGQPQNRSFIWTTSQVKHQMVHPLTNANALISLTANFPMSRFMAWNFQSVRLKIGQAWPFLNLRFKVMTKVFLEQLVYNS